jgi:hyperosmotically inducible periplasmic protein
LQRGGESDRDRLPLWTSELSNPTRLAGAFQRCYFFFEEEVMRSTILASAAIATLLLCVACSSNSGDNASYKDNVKKALEQAELTDVSVAEDRDKNTVTLTGTVHSDDAKAKAADVAKGSAGNRIVVNEVSVQPVGAESDAKSIASNVDDAIEKNYKAALISNGLEKQHIDFKAKNGVLTLKGSVKTVAQRHEAQSAAASVPNVQQVLNQIDVKR